MARKDIYEAPYDVEHPFDDIAASQTDVVLQAGVPGKRIRVIAFIFVCGDTDTDASFGSDGTAISPVYPNAANSGAVGPWNPSGWFTTERGEALTVTTGAGSTTAVLATTVLV